VRHARPLLAGSLAAVALAAPATAHLLVRGTPLSEWAASSPVAVAGRIADTQDGVTLEVEEAVLGELPTGTLRFTAAGHHPPEYAVGARVLVFLETSAPPWRSRQTALDAVDVPADLRARRALLEAVRAYAGLRRVTDRNARIAQLETLALRNLASESARVRSEALLDLMAIVPADSFDAADVQRVTSLAMRAKSSASLAPGLVVLLAAIRRPEAEDGLIAVMGGAADPRARARATRVMGRRRGEAAETMLRGALEDPAPAVRLTARRELERIARAAAAAGARPTTALSKPREGAHDAEALHPDPS
jgi:hypothetical protein